MRFKKTIAGAATGTLVAASAFLIASPASAADFYLEASDLATPEVSPYADDWFTGGGSSGTVTDSGYGIVIEGRHQILNGDTPATGLPGLVGNADMTVASGNAWFQIAVYFDHDGDDTTAPAFTTLRKKIDSSNPVWDSSDWTASLAYAEGALSTQNSIDGYVAEFTAGGGDYEVLAFGVYVDTDETATISSITWAGDTFWFTDGPITATISDSEVTVDEIKDPGITATFSGFVPGEEVEAFYGGGSWGDTAGNFTADSDGNVVVTLATDLSVGDYQLGAYSLTTGASATVAFSVTAAELAATGAEAAPLMIGGAALLLLGAGAFVIARRGKRA